MAKTRREERRSRGSSIAAEARSCFLDSMHPGTDPDRKRGNEAIAIGSHDSVAH
ncbi:MAG: hypothetical protein ACR2OE_18435 [Thermomicrobiales bacterium]